MKVKETRVAPRRTRWPVSIALLCSTLAMSLTAHAEYVGSSPFQGAPLSSLKGTAAGSASLNSTQLVWGTSLNINTLATTEAGTLTIKLEDLGWPDPLQSLKILVTDLDGIWEVRDGSTSFSLFLSGPTNVFAAVYAKSVDGGLGLYNLHSSFAPVPLPAAAWLLLSGLGGLGLLRRRPSSN